MEAKSLENLEFARILALVADCASSQAAKEAILKTEPSDCISVIETLLAEVSEYFEYSESGLKLGVGAVYDIKDIIEALESNSIVLGSEDFLRVKFNIQTAISLKKQLESAPPALIQAKNTIIAERIRKMPALTQLEKRINDCLDDKGIVRANATPTLSSIRHEHASIAAQTEKQLNEFLRRHADDVQDKYFTMRNERYCLPVLASAQSRVQGIVHDQSSTGQTLFIEPLAFLPANNRLAQLRLSEREEIKRIFINLTAMLADAAEQLKNQLKTMTWLDTIKARADFASKYNASCPEIALKQELHLKNARHPLLCPTCVPLSVDMNEKQKCIIITGPNGGGKTVALKTIGINALLMQTGNYVLAEKDAKLPVFKQIFSDIGENQSIDEHLSTFTAHLKRLKEISDAAFENSLVLIDEICVGTDPAEGAPLASGFLKEITKRGAFSVVTSHYDALKHTAFVTEGFVNAAMEFDYETFKPTFRFQIGVPGKSNALAMARAFGISASILIDLIGAEGKTSDDEKKLIEAIERERNRAEGLRRTYVERLIKLRARETEAEETLKQLKEFRKTKRDKLTEEFTAQTRRQIREIEALISQFKLLTTQPQANDEAKTKKLPEGLKQARGLHAKAKELIKDLEAEQKKAAEEFSAPINQKALDKSLLKAGTEVVWLRNMQIGTLKSIDCQKKRAKIEFEGKIFNVAANELSIAPKKDKKNSGSTGTVYAVRPLIKSELDLRGKRVEEAINEVASFLSLAGENGLDRVFIIHGKGTGALQRAVSDYLKKSPYKKKFRPGRYGEGDLGVTVVVFNPEADVDKNDPRYPKNTKAN